MTEKEIHDKIDEWHESTTDMSLHTYLGMTKEEYYIWVKKGLAETVKERLSFASKLFFMSIATTIISVALVTVIWVYSTDWEIGRICNITVITVNAVVQIMIANIMNNARKLTDNDT